MTGKQTEGQGAAEFKIADPLLRRIMYAVGIMGTIAFGFYTFSLVQGALTIVFNVLTPFLVALILAYILAPVVIGLQRRLKLGRVMGTLVLYLIIFLVIFILMAFVIPTILSQFVKLFQGVKEAMPALLTKLSENKYLQVDADLIKAIQNKIKTIDVDYQKVAGSLLPALQKAASGGFEAVGEFAKGIFSGVGSIIGFFSFVVFIGIINFYIILDWEKTGPFIRKMVPPEYRERVFDVLGKIDTAVGGFLRGQLTVSAIVGASFAIGLFSISFFGFPSLRNYCILIGAVAAIGGFIPYLGSIIGVTPGILIVLLTGGVSWGTRIIGMLAVLGLFTLIQAIEGFVLQPKIVGKGAGLHPLVVMLALIAGAQFGIGAMIIAVPVACIVRVLIREFYWLPVERREASLAESSGQMTGKV
ncbi:MAG: AI-2E family transporter [Deltaproteobacteria bacterium]|nr:AI-2E family transporter [Deltaproteobacteria bacterium]MBW2170884.1 AI-2E family transporter [Deltaproteobacteria bacterium]MBW2259607.1 AI-2E family transporter [Deltaproteobacteria bacterium]